MIYRRESELGSRMDRKLIRAVKELNGECELLACDSETLEYQLGMSMRGAGVGEILSEIQAEAFTVLGMCEHVRALLDEGAGICRF